MRYKEGERGRQTVYMRHVYKEPRDLYVDMGVGGRERERERDVYNSVSGGLSVTP